MKTAYFQWFVICERNHRREEHSPICCFVPEIDMEFNITEESAAPVAVEGTITVAEEAGTALRSLDSPTQKLAELVKR
jgi:hypothetical protein